MVVNYFEKRLCMARNCLANWTRSLRWNLKLVSSRASCTAVLGLLCISFLSQPLHAQSTTERSTQVTTQERLETELWWPTKSTSPLRAYAGSKSCLQCHTQTERATSMQRAATVAGADDFLAGHLSPTLNTSAITYTLAKKATGLEFQVSDGLHESSQTLGWVFGAGDLGRTFLYPANGRWYQSQLSYYTRIAALDITTGLPPSHASSLQEAIGQQLSPQDARSCFNCHTVHATTSAGLDPLHAEPGIGCEACHGPGRDHSNTMSAATHAGNAATPDSKVVIFNPAKLSPSDSIDFCGSCHRSFADASLSTGQGAETAVVRFQPYRLEESKCWRATKDERLTCVACHDPHQPLNRDMVSYDNKCIACHDSKNLIATHPLSLCPKATSHCATCHMQKVTIASMHGDFTDHFIRIVRVGEPLPR
jgi:predicted CXXCH cytochrome family protein